MDDEERKAQENILGGKSNKPTAKRKRNLPGMFSAHIWPQTRGAFSMTWKQHQSQSAIGVHAKIPSTLGGALGDHLVHVFFSPYWGCPSILQHQQKLILKHYYGMQTQLSPKEVLRVASWGNCIWLPICQTSFPWNLLSFLASFSKISSGDWDPKDN